MKHLKNFDKLYEYRFPVTDQNELDNEYFDVQTEDEINKIKNQRDMLKKLSIDIQNLKKEIDRDWYHGTEMMKDYKEKNPIVKTTEPFISTWWELVKYWHERMKK